MDIDALDNAASNSLRGDLAFEPCADLCLISYDTWYGGDPALH